MFRWDVSLAGFVGGLISGIWWPHDYLIAAIAGLLGAFSYLGVRSEIVRMIQEDG